MESERDIIAERNSEIRELEFENDLLRAETGSMDLYIRLMKAEAAERDARIAELTGEVERLREGVRLADKWFNQAYHHGTQPRLCLLDVFRSEVLDLLQPKEAKQ